MLFMTVELLFHSLDGEVTWYLRIIRPHRDSCARREVYVKCTQHKLFDHAGRQSGYTITLDKATAEAFQEYKNRYLPPSMRMSSADRSPEEAVTKKAIVYLRKSQTAGAEKLSFLSGVVKQRTREMKAASRHCSWHVESVTVFIECCPRFEV